MLRSNFAPSAVTPKSVIGVSVLFLILAAIFGLFNNHKVKMLRTNAAAIRDVAEHKRATQGRNLEIRETTAGEGEAKIAEAENKAAKAEAELTQLQKEKSDLQSKVDANQDEIASLQKRIEEAENG
jgi:peptidoglycan hydrolase CwlO-like protein